MKLPPSHSRARTILSALLNKSATVADGIERHSALGLSKQGVADLYLHLEIGGWLVKSGDTYSVSTAGRKRLAPTEQTDDTPPTEPAYRGNWQIGSLNAATARRSGAAFGLDWIRP
jgi:hypothetical protein